jgi:hypothetical protein
MKRSVIEIRRRHEVFWGGINGHLRGDKIDSGVIGSYINSLSDFLPIKGDNPWKPKRGDESGSALLANLRMEPSVT